MIQIRSDEETLTRWTLGNVFLRHYDSVYDLENRRIGLIGKVKTESDYPDFLTKMNVFEVEALVYWLIGSSLLVFLIISLCVFHCCLRKNLQYRKKVVLANKDIDINSIDEMTYSNLITYQSQNDTMMRYDDLTQYT